MSELADRQKVYEAEYNYIIKQKTFLIRLDGKGFSKRIKQWKCRKPFDPEFHYAMCDCCKALMKEIPSIKMAWTGSDEITLLFNYTNNEYYYSNRVNKLLSLIASMTTATFNQSMNASGYNINEYPAYFDARIITPPNLIEAMNNIVYRIHDGIRNSISMWYSKFYSHKQSMKLNSVEKIEKMKMEQDFDWNTTPSNWTKYGELFYYVKKKFIREEDNTEYFRNVIYCDSQNFTGCDLLKLLNGEK